MHFMATPVLFFFSPSRGKERRRLVYSCRWHFSFKLGKQGSLTESTISRKKQQLIQQLLSYSPKKYEYTLKKSVSFYLKKKKIQVKRINLRQKSTRGTKFGPNKHYQTDIKKLFTVQINHHRQECGTNQRGQNQTFHKPLPQSLYKNLFINYLSFHYNLMTVQHDGCL